MIETLPVLIKSENEQLIEGKNPLVSPMDRHSMHIKEHKSVLADPELRMDANLVKISMDHIEAHLNALRQTDPSLQMCGEQPLPPLVDPNAPQEQPPQDPNGPPPNAQHVVHHQAPARVLERSPMNDIMQGGPENGPGGNKISGQGVNNESLPGVPTPPAPFNNLPTDPSQMIPG